MMRQKIGLIAAILGIILFVYILLYISGLAPLIPIKLFGEPFIRLISQAAILLFVVAAWAYWKI